MPGRYKVGDRVAEVMRPLVGGAVSAVREYPMPAIDPAAREPFTVYEVSWEDGFAGVCADEDLMLCLATPAMTQFALAQEAALARLRPALEDARRLGAAAEEALARAIGDARAMLERAQQADGLRPEG